MSLFTRRKPDERDEVAAPYEPPAPVVREPATIGELLRSKRESFGVTLVDVGTTLRIRAAFLEAIEDDRYDRLPGAAYALGFVRTYADHLGLDGDAMARRYKSEVAGFQPKRDLAFPMPLSERSLPGGAVLLVALILAACAYAVWYYRASGDRARPDRVAEVPAQVVPLPPPSEVPRPPNADATPPAGATDTAPASPTAPDASAPSTTPQPNQTADTAPAAPPAAAVPPAPAPVAAAPQAAAPPAPVQAAAPPAIPEPPPATPASNAPRVFGPSSGPVRIVLKAATDSWIQVREPNQSVLSMRTLKAGDSYRVPDRPGLTLRTGNAGGLEVTVDGKPVPPVGPPGKSRTVALDPDKLAAGNAAAE
jgi:cytoskeleton protein RodZ